MKEQYRKLIRDLNLGIPAIAIKMCFEKPEGVAHYEGDKLAFCQYVKEAQLRDKPFYITVDDDACYGKLAMGMIDKPPVTASGQAGFDFGVYKTPSANQQLYQKLPILEPHTVNYVMFARAVDCEFDPELLFFVTTVKEADVIMRATSYISGDLWESVSSPVLSCAWMYAYPIISGKVNHITTGLYHGLKRRKAYPEGLRMISIPYRKHPEFFTALEEMDHTLIAFREDEESKKELARRMAHWQDMADAIGGTCDLR